MTRICRKCLVVLVVGDNWSEGQVRANNYQCRPCMSNVGKAWAKANPKKVLESGRRRYKKSPEAVAAYKSQYYQKHKEKWRQYHNNWAHENRIDPERRARRMNTWTRSRARKMGLDFDLTPEFIFERLNGGRCAVTGIEFVLTEIAGGKKGTDPFAPSIDRIDPAKGYTQDNVRLVAYIYNCAKSEYADSDVLKLARAIVGIS